jgi:hypothetical protein
VGVDLRKRLLQACMNKETGFVMIPIAIAKKSIRRSPPIQRIGESYATPLTVKPSPSRSVPPTGHDRG